MKKIITICALTLITINFFGQSPEKMSYQSVIRNTSNALVTNSTVGLRISILQTSPSGSAVYVETQTPTSNANGLVSVEIGAGSIVSGIFTSIDWANGPYFIKTETDPTGGTSYTITGTSQLLSVPYALHAKNSDSWYLDGDTTKTDYRVKIQNSLLNVEGSNFTNLLISNNGNGDPNIWLRDIDSSITWRIHNDQSRDNIFSIRPWNEFSGYGGTTWINTNSDPFSIDTVGRVSIGNGVNFKESFNVYHQDSAFINIETSGNNEAGIVMSELGGVRGARIFVDGSGTNNLIFQVKDDFGQYVDVMHMPYFPGSQVGNVGIGTDSPARTLHVNSVMRLEPIATAPTSPAKGDIYMNGTTNKLMVYDGTTWQACW
jgi:hypothetical protein